MVDKIICRKTPLCYVPLRQTGTKETGGKDWQCPVCGTYYSSRYNFKEYDPDPGKPVDKFWKNHEGQYGIHRNISVGLDDDSC